MLKLAPQVGAIVEFGMNSFNTGPATYRVSSYLCAAEAPKLATDDFIGEILFDSCRTFDRFGGIRLRSCMREEAQYLSLVGICGAIAPIDQCKVIGMVDWSQTDLDEERDHAERLGRSREMIF